MFRTIAFWLAALVACSAFAQGPAKPAAEAQTPAAEAEKADTATAKAVPASREEPDPKIVEDLFACIAEGLPQDWKKAWFVITETRRSKDGATRSYAADFFYAMNASDRKGKPLLPCGAEKILEGVGALNDYLPDGQRRWTRAIFTFLSDGKYDVKYDYTPRKPASSKPEAKPATKKKQEASK